MPTTYAHWRFGDHCLSLLPQNLQQIVLNHREIFDYGVHGPDIYFYYNVLKYNKVNAFGNTLHSTPYSTILKTFHAHLSECNDREAALSYILGFTCHFTLDTYCHSFIEKVDKTTAYSHNKIESQFDRYLMEKDHLNPVKTRVTTTLKPDRAMALTISTLFSHFDTDTVYKTLKDQKLYLNLLKDRNGVKRWFLETGMTLIRADNFKDLLTTTETLEDLKGVLLRLDKLFEAARQHYPFLAENVMDYMEKDTPLDPYLDHTFSYRKDYMDIPVFQYEEEQHYVVNSERKTTL